MMATATAGTPATDLTLDELRLALAPEVASAAMFDGWTAQAVTTAAEAMGVSPDTARIAFPGGAMDMIAAWIERIDADMHTTFADSSLQSLPVRQRIRTLVQFRLDALDGLDEAVRRALAIMAMPQNAARTARLSWQSADAMWRLAGDTAADFNHYTKRATLAALYAATLLALVNDRSDDKAETRAFLDRRIEGVMRFEKAKARWMRPDDERFSVTRLLGRLRYPAR
ncbi:COQ9 family protein [Novosphingobium aerophilum]|uniref:COQ9 family protein n=1 Tax=Novosphingobium aerophilum TaxID=2839843 RepID=A0A7X1F9T6_9SPHN|nr:COQ9 family protein [Novosphingobium aerophilum]MBC2653040.1 COQ9 family protein [Novosphingobium aerophilum]